MLPRHSLAWALAAVLAGCAALPPGAREDHAAAFLDDLGGRTREALLSPEELSLEDCVALALAHNLDVEAASIEARIGELERQIAFANFLPTVTAGLQQARWDRQPKSKMLGPLAVPMHDQSLREITLDIQMPVVVPATWFLYAMYADGAEIRQLVLDFVRQQVTLRTAALYFTVLSMEEAARAFETQADAAEALRCDVAAFRAEGMAAAWQVKQAEALLLARRNLVDETWRARDQARAELLAFMGLDPRASLTLAGDGPITAPRGSEQDLVLEALLNNLQLHAADRQVVIAKNQVRIALAEFLPSLAGFTTYTHSSNSMNLYAESWMSGVAGVLSLFDGLANVRQYQAARERKRAAYVEREAACLALIVQVLEARRGVQDAQNQQALAGKAFEAAAGRYDEARARYAEGLLTPAALLAERAAFDEAQMHVVQARFRRRVAAAALLNVLGRGYAGFEVNYEDEL